MVAEGRSGPDVRVGVLVQEVGAPGLVWREGLGEAAAVPPGEGPARGSRQKSVGQMGWGNLCYSCKESVTTSMKAWNVSENCKRNIATNVLG